jgi:hypothetical protein
VLRLRRTGRRNCVSPQSHGIADFVLGGSLSTVSAPVTQAGVPLSLGRLQSRAGVYVQPTTLSVTRLVLREAGLAIDGGPALIPLSDSRFAIAGEAAQISFADGVHAGYERRTPGQSPARFEWRQPVVANAALLAQYAGDYVSGELGGVMYHLSAGDSTLTLRTGTSDPFVARVAFGDTFVAENYTIQFARSGSAVTGFEVTNSRMRHVKFTKRP